MSLLLFHILGKKCAKKCKGMWSWRREPQSKPWTEALNRQRPIEKTVDQATYTIAMRPSQMLRSGGGGKIGENGMWVPTSWDGRQKLFNCKPRIQPWSTCSINGPGRLDSSSIANTISCSWIGNWGALGEYLEPLQCFAGSTASTLQTAHLLLEIHILLGRQDTWSPRAIKMDRGAIVKERRH